MFIYAGIDEAGYGPLLGPMVVGRAVLAIPALPHDAPAPDLWRRLSKAVCKRISDRAGRIPVNDSKKLTTKAAGVRHLETGCLAFAQLAGDRPATLDAWLDSLGETTHRLPDLLPWYAPANEAPWQTLPAAQTDGELAIAGAMLSTCTKRIGVEMAGLGAAVIFEDRFNRMAAATRSKASVSFTFVAQHLDHVWQHHGQHHPNVVVDRQGGRTRYRDILAQSFEDTRVDVIEETETLSCYEIKALHGDRGMRVSFMVDAEQQHMPVALASMVSKYTRELLMHRLNDYFARRVPGLKPTAGYAKDGKRYLEDLTPHLPALGIDPASMRRIV